MGYVFNKAYHGKGYATEAVRAVVDNTFKFKNAHRFVAFCNVLNEPSWHLLERIGMRREAHRVKNMFFDNDEKGDPLWFDSYQYAILETEWHSE
ncbi:GNAT family protein [Fusibacter sp. A2]|uniref:GNAT family N-acetyltransferase n=1 Tax=unclassified Fusibacter TaxID=2624464 RepID=UPI0032B75BC3